MSSFIKLFYRKTEHYHSNPLFVALQRFLSRTVIQSMSKDRLTEKKHWDDYWENYPLPAEVKQSKDQLLLNEELKIFERYLPNKPLSILEIGGAPGQYLA